MKKLSSKRVVVVICLLLAALFIIRPPASRLRNKVLGSIGAALGRNVEVSSLHLRFLPRPGFELENLVIHDNAAFGAEPLLRAPDVTAWLQVKALLRGHIAISSLNLSDASVNLMRNSAGQWNFEDLIERTSRINAAPTAAGNRTSRPQFPYIEATGARINFKAGAEKTHFALTDAKFDVWHDSENTWGIRLRTRPIRTDANLTDTGLLDVSGSWQRSAVLHEMPLQFSFEWKRAPIGQMSKLVYGSDKGWRGSAAVSGEIVGTPGDLKLTVDGSVEDFRRQDVLGSNDLRLTAHCSAEYGSVEKTVSNLECTAPSGSGTLELKGSASVGPNLGTPFSAYDLRLLADNVRAGSVLALVQHMNANLASHTIANGRADASFQLSRTNNGSVRFYGNGTLQELRLTSDNMGGEVAVGTVPFSLGYGGPGSDRNKRHGPKSARDIPTTSATTLDSAEQPHVEIGPFNVLLGRTSPLQVHASVSSSDYQAWIRGDAGVKRLLQSARILGIPAPSVNAEGSSTVDLNIAGSWSGNRPTMLGTAQLRSVYAQIRGVNAPIGIAKANLILEEDAVRVLNLNASAADAVWHGSLRIPRPCGTPADCQFQFNLRTAELSAVALNKFFNPALQKKSWYKFLSLTDDNGRYLLHARAAGKIAVDKLLLGKTACSHLTTDMSLDEGRVTLSGLNGEVLGGAISGNWKANFKLKPPEYTGSGSFEGISLAEVSELMHDGWIDGAGKARYEFTAAGWNLRDLLNSADLNAEFSISDGSFPQIALTSNSGPLRTPAFSGNIQLHEGEFLFRDAKLETPNGVYTVSGPASLTGALNLKMAAEGAPGFIVSGTVLETRVSANPTTAASLKP